MALTSIDAQGMVQRCASCGAQSRLDFIQLSAGGNNTVLQKAGPDLCPPAALSSV